MPDGPDLRLAHRQRCVGAGKSAAGIACAVGLHVADVQHEGEIGLVHVPDERRHPGFIGAVYGRSPTMPISNFRPLSSFGEVAQAEARSARQSSPPAE